MKILILNGSPRRQGLVAQMLAEVAQNIAPAHEVETLNVYDLDIHPCLGCMRCRSHVPCVLPPDDAHRVAEKINAADVLVIGTPTYWGNMSGQLKLLFDRLVDTLMENSANGTPAPHQKGKRAIIVATCSTVWPFNILFHQSRGAVRALREILKWSGYRIIGTLEKGGTQKHGTLSAGEKKKCARLGRKI